MEYCKSPRSQLLGFIKSVIKASIFLRCGAASLWNCFPKFQDKLWYNFYGLKKFSVLDFSTFEDKASTFPQDASTKPPVEKWYLPEEWRLNLLSRSRLANKIRALVLIWELDRERNWRTACNGKSKLLIKSISWKLCKKKSWGHCLMVKKCSFNFVISELMDATPQFK